MVNIYRLSNHKFNMGAQIYHGIVNIWTIDMHIPMQEHMHITIALNFFI